MEDEKVEKFIIFALDKITMQEGGITNTRVKELTFGMKTFSIYIDSHFVNNIISYITGLQGLLSDETITPFISSKLMANYSRLIDILTKIDKETLKQDGKGAIANKQMIKAQNA